MICWICQEPVLEPPSDECTLAYHALMQQMGRAARELGSDLVALGLAPPPDLPAGLRRS